MFFAVSSSIEHAEEVVEFYRAFSALSMTLLGFWITVVKLRFASGQGTPDQRRNAYTVALFFLLPGVMSLAAAAIPDEPAVWRFTFASCALLGAIEAITYSIGAGLVRSTAPTLVRSAGVALYILIFAIAAAPKTFQLARLAPRQVEALLLIGLAVCGVHMFWFGLTAPDQSSAVTATSPKESG
ncbi:hypothetical protein ACIHFC_35725 [Streptomyces sp. NPDC052013]|uniref:hypothetical protein n=1 Tax=Streptomyces sp. NPDC052013 TaxID=3365679 RepID=UPI0037CD2E3F